MVRRLKADVLGIFGREGLDMACRWEVPAAGTPVYNAFKLYRNYDGAKAHFGETSVRPAPHIRTISRLFSAVRSDGALTVMVINKVATGNALDAERAALRFRAAAQVWQLGASNSIAGWRTLRSRRITQHPGAGAKHHAVRDQPASARGA